MTYLLVTHERGYRVSCEDAAFSAATLCSGVPYAKRHWDLANRAPEHCLGHRIIATLQAIPVLGLLFCLIERVIAFMGTSEPIKASSDKLHRTKTSHPFSSLKTSPRELDAAKNHPPIVLPESFAITTVLEEARQYDRKDAPATCTFHAICGMSAIATRFDHWFELIRTTNIRSLSTLQNEVIDRGLAAYRQALEDPLNVNQRLLEGADFAHIRAPNISRYLPKNIQLKQPENYENLDFQFHLKNALDHLFASKPNIKTVWFKNGNSESFGVVATGTRAIIFDSHKNEIVATNTRGALEQILSNRAHMKLETGDGVYRNFEYAITAS